MEGNMRTKYGWTDKMFDWIRDRNLPFNYDEFRKLITIEQCDDTNDYDGVSFVWYKYVHDNATACLIEPAVREMRRAVIGLFYIGSTEWDSVNIEGSNGNVDDYKLIEIIPITVTDNTIEWRGTVIKKESE